MTSHYINIISIACLFLCLTIASASTRSSLIRQFTDGFNTSLQSSEENGARANLEEAKHMLHNHQEISSRDYNVSSLREKRMRFPLPLFTLTIHGFSTLLDYSYMSKPFLRGGRRWNLQLYPNGQHWSEGSFSVYLGLNENEILKPYERINVVAKIRVLNLGQFSNVEKTISGWYNNGGESRGFSKFMSVADIKDPSKGFLAKDELYVQVEFEKILKPSTLKFL